MYAMLQASFKNTAQEQQHLAGPAHRKALARQQADQEQRSRLAKGRDAANSAVVRLQAQILGMHGSNPRHAWLLHGQF